MKVLWIVNMVFPSVAKEIGIKTSTSGGWLLDLASAIGKKENVELGVMTYYSGEKFIDMELDGVRYFLFPGGGKRLLHENAKTGDDCKKVVELFKPDLIHIHGTEYAPGYEMLKVHPEIPTVLTIQGIIHRIAEEYYGGFSLWEILKMSKLKDILRGKIPLTYKMLYKKNAKREIEVLKRVKYVTGRTDWDKSTMLAINPELKYYRCNYNLRDAFYGAEKWSLNTMTRHTIITGAGHNSLKGLHIVIKALAIVKNKYPDVKLYIPGGGKAENGRLVNPSSYTKHIEKMISDLGLDENVVYLGNLGPEKVAEYLKNSNVCVVPSAIEGASATLCEAMMIGTPSISSYRGGMTDLLTDKVNGFTYDFPEYPQLALRIMEIFENDEMAVDFSKKTIDLANARHNREKNPDDMVKVYEEVISNEHRA
jgi:glycosyltransferase involved in cell wall biosynthesis